jgi:hypothetical protein
VDLPLKGLCHMGGGDGVTAIQVECHNSLIPKNAVAARDDN